MYLGIHNAKKLYKKLYLKFIKDTNDELLISNEINRLKKNILPKKQINNLSDAMAELFTNIASTFRSDFTNKYSIIYTNFSLYFKNDFEIFNLIIILFNFFMMMIYDNSQKSFYPFNANIFTEIDYQISYIQHIC